jgi:hypothetical protein
LDLLDILPPETVALAAPAPDHGRLVIVRPYAISCYVDPLAALAMAFSCL